MIDLDPGTLASIGGSILGAVVWLVRLEGRVNASDATAAALKLEIAAIKARADADSKASEETTIALVRVQEQLKYLTSLFERHFVEGPVPRPRRGGAG